MSYGYIIVVDMKKYKCIRCGHTWYPRSPKKPRWCPKCNSPYWDKPVTKPTKGKKKHRYGAGDAVGNALDFAGGVWG